ncbi:unnamed protein product, partial [Medioppia subpectinata]
PSLRSSSDPRRQSLDTSDSCGHNMENEEYESLPTSDVKIHMTAGAIAGVMEHVVMYPLDSVKTRMQSLYPNPKASYRSVPEALYKMVRHEGLLRPIRGVSAVTMGAGPAHALYFSCYEKMKRVLSGSETGAHHPIAQGGAGCLATLLHDAVMNPAEVVKARMQVFNSPYKSAMNCFLDVYRREGLRAFYRSYMTSISMNIPTQSLHFITYEFMQEMTNSERNYSPKAHMMSGAIAGGFAAAVTTPLDVCKTLLNTQEKQTLKTSKQNSVTGLWNAATTIYMCCGPKGYFQGLQARVLYSMPATAISWSVYELFKYLMTSKDVQKTHSISSATHLPNFASHLNTSEAKWDNKRDSVLDTSVTHPNVITSTADNTQNLLNT